MALYSNFGIQTIVSGTKVTPFGFQGSYSDSTGLVYLINRYYDPVTDEFLSIDPDVADTGQPYVFADDNPLNSADPQGLCGSGSEGCGQGNLNVQLLVKKLVKVLKKAERKAIKGESGVGQGLSAAANFFGNIGLVMDNATIVDSGSIVLAPADLVTIPGSALVNVASTGLSCGADFVNKGFSISAQAECAEGGTLLAISFGQFSTSSEKKFAQELGDLQQAFTDAGATSGWLNAELHKLITAGGMG